MAHYAFLDENNIVTEVITGKNENELLDGLTPEEWYGKFRSQKCIRTSYNSKIRKHFAAVGYTYNEELDAFIPPKPFDSWKFDEQFCNWVAPINKPENMGMAYWDESEKIWKKM